MTKRWHGPRRYRQGHRTPQSFGPAAPGKSLIGTRDIWIVVGASCPWSTTPGERTVYHFRSVAEARAAGFTHVT